MCMNGIDASNGRVALQTHGFGQITLGTLGPKACGTMARSKQLSPCLEASATKLCDDVDSEPGFERVAIYAVGNEPNLSPQHAARQLPSGRWTSKLGDWEDIEHHELRDVESPDYGRVVHVMRRPSVA